MNVGGLIGVACSMVGEADHDMRYGCKLLSLSSLQLFSVLQPMINASCHIQLPRAR